MPAFARTDKLPHAGGGSLAADEDVARSVAKGARFAVGRRRCITLLGGGV